MAIYGKLNNISKDMHRGFCFLSILTLISTLWFVGIVRINLNKLQLSILLKECSDRVKFLKHNDGHAMQRGGQKLHSEINALTKISFMSHIIDKPKALVPALLKTADRSNVTMVLGIVTTAKEKVPSLKSTLNNLINNMNELERNDTLIIILVEEMEWSILNDIVLQLEDGFAYYMKTGLIDVIAPHPSYYPHFQNMCLALHNDLVQCAQWRIKQCLNIIYLMAYAQNRGSYYVQLDNDLLTETNFMSIMRHFVDLANNKEPAWIVLDFCEDDVIGKTFKSEELPQFIIFMEMFYNHKPFNWILHKYIEVKVCDYSLNFDCAPLKVQYWWTYYPPLFYKTNWKLIHMNTNFTRTP